MRNFLIALSFLAGTALMPAFASAQATSGDVNPNAPATVTVCVALQNDLSRGTSDAQTGGEVSILQRFLVSTSTTPTSAAYLVTDSYGNFGNLTENAVKHFQTDQGLLVNGSASGFVGPLTRARIRNLTCTGISTSPNFTATPLSGNAPLSVSFTFQAGQPNAQYRISFGDDQFSAHMVPCQQTTGSCTSGVGTVSHTYTTPGTYTANLTRTVLNDCWAGTAAAACAAWYSREDTIGSATITVTSGSTNTVTLTATPTSGSAPLLVHFTVPNSSPTLIASYQLDFGDGHSSSMNSVSCQSDPLSGASCVFAAAEHIYTSAGTYVARLIIPIHDCGAVGTLCAGSTLGSATITVNAQSSSAPTVTLTASPTSITSGQSSTLTLSSQNASSCTVSNVDWPSGRTTGTTTVSLTQTTTYVATCTGTGSSSTVSQSATVTVTGSGTNTAMLIATPTSGAAPLRVNFVAHNSDPTSIPSYQLDFGDGSSSSDWQNWQLMADGGGSRLVSHTYTSARTYTAKLRNIAMACTPTDCNVIGTATITVTAGTGTSTNNAECTNIQNDLSYGSRDSQTNGEVSLLQAFFQSTISPTTGIAYLTGEPTGGFYNLTKAAVALFQKDNGLDVTAVVGPKTRARIKALTCGGTSSAIFSASPTSGPAPLSVVFSMSQHMEGNFQIDFGDGTIRNTDDSCLVGPDCKEPYVRSHTYSSAGTYTAKLRNIAMACAPVDCNVIGTATITVTGGNDTSPSTAECTEILNDLSYGSRDSQTNGEVSLLQAYFQSAISPGTGARYLTGEPTGGFFGLTKAAVIQFQRDNGLPTTGLVGPATRGKIRLLTCGDTGTPTPPLPPPTCNVQLEMQSCATGAYAARIAPNCAWAVCPSSGGGGSAPSLNGVSISVSSSPDGPWVLNGSVRTDQDLYIKVTGLNTSNPPKACAGLAQNCASPTAFRVFTASELPLNSTTAIAHSVPGVWPAGTYNAYGYYPETGIQQVGSFTITAAGGGTSSQAPTANLTINLSHYTTLPVGSSYTWVWSSTNGTSFSSTYSSNDQATCGGGQWVANTANGTNLGTITSALAGCQWTVNYTVTGPGGTRTDTAYVTVPSIAGTTWPAPVITSIRPTSVSVGVNANIIVNGSNFKPGAVIAYSGTSSGEWPVSYLSSAGNEISVGPFVWGTAGSWTFRVKNTDGQMSGVSGTFTVTGQSNITTCPTNAAGVIGGGTCSCPANSATGSVWGSDPYTKDSNICSAAVHAGKITLATGGNVTYTVISGCSAYTGSARNGITSLPWGAYTGSVSFDGATCTATPATTATLTQSVSSTVSGVPYTITWGSTNATSCNVTYTGPDGGGTISSGPTSGSVTPTTAIVGTYVATNTCTGASGQSAPASITHTVTTANTNTPTELTCISQQQPQYVYGYGKVDAGGKPWIRLQGNCSYFTGYSVFDTGWVQGAQLEKSGNCPVGFGWPVTASANLDRTGLNVVSSYGSGYESSCNVAWPASFTWSGSLTTGPGPTVDLTQSSATSNGQTYISWNSANADSCIIAYSTDGLKFTNWRFGTSGNNVGTSQISGFNSPGTWVFRATCTGNGTPAVDKVIHTIVAERNADS